MKNWTARTHITIGLTFLVASTLLMAVLFGLIPDRLGAIREGRIALAEAVAMHSSSLLSSNSTNRGALTSDFEFLLERNDSLKSIAIRRSGGESELTLGAHDEHWDAADPSLVDAQITVPIWSNNGRWGQVELRFTRLIEKGWRGYATHPVTILFAIVLPSLFCAFFFYLGRMLKHLNPNRAIPPHVRAALDTLAEGLLVVDLTGSVVLANRSFADYVGCAPDDLTGEKTTSIPWCGEDGVALGEDELPWSNSLRDGEHALSQMVCLQEHGVIRSFLVNCSPVFSGTGKHHGVLISFDDVTELEAHKAELEISKVKAEEANRAKSEFLANMSHEIRTPMNAILGFTDVLRMGRGKSESDWKKHLGTIHSSGKHLLQLINDILDLSKVEADRLEVERLTCHPHQIIHEVVRVLEVKAKEKGITLTFDFDGALPERIQTDPTRLRQIVTNLVGNAIKFTDQGGVRLVARVVPAGDESKYAIDIIDTGVGIPEEKLTHIFEAFAQADSSVTRRFGGTGLGLAISRNLARALGGDIRVASAVGKGSVFTLTLDPGPLAGVRLVDAVDARTEDDITDETDGKQWQFPNAKILVVDDGEENRELLKVVLGDFGLSIHEAENGAVAVKRATSESFDVILMDMQMPVMDGHEATRTIRAKGIKTPVVALTANAMKGFERECMDSGCTDYLTKPLDVNDLLDTLATFLPGSTRVEVDALPDTPEPVGAKASAIVSRLAGDARFFKAIGKFASRLDEQVASAEAALREGELDVVAGIGHWLKGSSGTVGFDSFVELAIGLERAAKAGDGSEASAWLGQIASMKSRIELSAEPSRKTDPSSMVKGQAVPVRARSTASTAMGRDPRFAKIRAKFMGRFAEQRTEAQRAADADDLSAVAGFAHWLKGSSGTVGFNALVEPAVALEAAVRDRNTDAMVRCFQEIDRVAAQEFALLDQDRMVS